MRERGVGLVFLLFFCGESFYLERIDVWEGIF